jgi:hypothetical protein
MLDIQKLAETTLRNPLATDAEKKKAKQAIRRLEAHEQNKMEITESCGKKPTRKNFANEQDYRAAMSAYWDALDRRAVRKQAEQILNARDSSPLSRHNARKRIEALDGPSPPENKLDEKKPFTNTFPTREDFGFQSGLDWSEFVAGKEAEFQAARDKWRQTVPPPGPKIAAFLDGLDEESLTVPKPAPHSTTPQTPIAPPIDSALFCERCRVPFKVCGCDKLTCPICWHPKANCYAPCPNARVRT